jgi:hypothetical protein
MSSGGPNHSPFETIVPDVTPGALKVEANWARPMREMGPGTSLVSAPAAFTLEYRICDAEGNELTIFIPAAPAENPTMAGYGPFPSISMTAGYYKFRIAAAPFVNGEALPPFYSGVTELKQITNPLTGSNSTEIAAQVNSSIASGASIETVTKQLVSNSFITNSGSNTPAQTAVAAISAVADKIVNTSDATGVLTGLGAATGPSAALFAAVKAEIAGTVPNAVITEAIKTAAGSGAIASTAEVTTASLGVPTASIATGAAAPKAATTINVPSSTEFTIVISNNMTTNTQLYTMKKDIAYSVTFQNQLNPANVRSETVTLVQESSPARMRITRASGAQTFISLGGSFSVAGVRLTASFLAFIGFNFEEDEPPAEGAVCFLGSAPVKTPSGWARIDSLAVGDLVCTADGRDVAIQRVKHQRIETPSATVNPYVIPAGQFGATENLAISPRHCVAVPGRGMVEARDLGLKQMTMRAAFDYYNLELPEWDNMVVAGVEVESLAPKKRVALTMAQFAALAASMPAEKRAGLIRLATVLADGKVAVSLTRKERRMRA